MTGGGSFIRLQAVWLVGPSSVSRPKSFLSVVLNAKDTVQPHGN